MKASRSFGQLAAAMLSVSTVVAAWPSFLPELDKFIVRRAETSKATTGKTTASANSTTLVGGAGGITLLTPTTVTGATQLYKIGDYVTWVWNYTSLQVTPTALDVLVSCSFATSTYTLTQNMTFETLGSYTWDTAAYETDHVNAQLLTQEYTLIIYDADSKMTAAAEAGYLDTYDSFTFGMYAAQSYTGLADGWTCATCSGAVSDMEKRALGFALTMSMVTVLSFTWFVTGMRLTL
ncbi:hypothetical protein CMQ_4273 [Grosmannia clavigera kw1407]|uniref:DUF7137 domain-containing protein n=1 Tax=Grosmannia clavigera (strain kw1407 / UAMH 11150) TaxID=655863 RepID=F0XUQ0_GROCL|nr:uncharacterized protein CMQ_4273 [Grosmannia clavigera kw1407]EFW98421.1 hypothetical protein CMQ_4273 [Grosmannia clavigera kw1407]